jgi:protein involved in polysaccharide export with SLBB domain
MLARSNGDYPVTPGDVYILTFLNRGEIVTNEVSVESNNIVNLNIFGKVDATGLSFTQLKAKVETIISQSYASSFPSLNITSVGIFNVLIRGAVSQTRLVTAWGLSRLSQVVNESLGEYSSIRRIEIQSKDKTSKNFDLQKALFTGDVDEDPYIKPGDTIIVHPLEKEVEIKGEVLRPGVYHLEKTENFTHLEAYFGNYTDNADFSHIKLDRKINGAYHSSLITIAVLKDAYPLEHGDIITIYSKIVLQPQIYIEGAISLTPISETAEIVVSDDTYNRITLQYNQGDTLYDALYQIKDSLLPFADLTHGFIIRNKVESIGIDMQAILYDNDLENNVMLEPFDRISIPVKIPYVVVIGAANNPGRYSYNPNQTYEYYISRAGGVDPERNSGNRVNVYDKNGKKRSSQLPIEPGDTIKVLSNDFVYSFNRFFPLIATSVAFIGSVITITNALNQ